MGGVSPHQQHRRQRLAFFDFLEIARDMRVLARQHRQAAGAQKVLGLLVNGGGLPIPAIEVSSGLSKQLYIPDPCRASPANADDYVMQMWLALPLPGIYV